MPASAFLVAGKKGLPGSDVHGATGAKANSLQPPAAKAKKKQK
jgi:hypothetical protein